MNFYIGIAGGAFVGTFIFNTVLHKSWKAGLAAGTIAAVIVMVGAFLMV